MKNKILRLVFTIWVALWIFFVLREMFIKSNFKDYNALLHRTSEGRRAYVTGERLYEFLTFCNDKLPEGANYMWVKTDKEDLARRRSTYYLYPHLETENAQFLLVYDNPGIARDDYEFFAGLDDSRYILKKKGL